MSSSGVKIRSLDQTTSVDPTSSLILSNTDSKTPLTKHLFTHQHRQSLAGNLHLNWNQTLLSKRMHTVEPVFLKFIYSGVMKSLQKDTYYQM